MLPETGAFELNRRLDSLVLYGWNGLSRFSVPLLPEPRVLLWLYYWLLYCATRHEVERAKADKEQVDLLDSPMKAADTLLPARGGRHQLPPVAAFIAAANRRFPLSAVKRLEDFNDLMPSFENC
jgi:hypothetical protein